MEPYFINPKWDLADRVHDWRNYINEDMRAVWDTFTPTQKRILAENAEEIAGREEWD